MIDVLITTTDEDNQLRTFTLRWKGDFYDLAHALRSWNHPMRINFCPLTPHPEGWDEIEEVPE